MTKEEFAQKIKQQHPQYNNLNDVELADKMLAKYPQYQSKITDSTREMGSVEKTARTLLPKSVEGFAETLGGATAVQTKDYKQAVESQQGLDVMNQKLASAIITNKKEGKDTSKLEELYERNTGKRLNLKDIIGETAEKTTKQIAGEAISTVGTTLIGAKAPSGVLGRLGVGSGLGTVFGTADALEQDKTAANVVTSGIIGGAIGLAFGGAFEGLGKLASKTLPRIGKHTFSKELQPPTKDLVKQIEHGFITFGEKVRKVTNDFGKAVYKGTYKTMREQATNELKTKGVRLNNLTKDYDSVINVSRSEVAGNIINTLQDTFGKLKDSQLKAIKFEVNRMATRMNATELLKNKRMYDGLIPDSFWVKMGDSNVAFISQVKYILRDNLRKTLNERTNNPLIQKLNNDLSIAMDVKHLASEQVAKRIKEKVSGQGGFFYKLIGRFIDDYLFNPAITTRTSQSTLRAGQNTGQTPLRSATRNVIIKEQTE